MTQQLDPTARVAKEANPPRGGAAPSQREGVTERALALTGAVFVVAVLAGNSLTETVAVADASARGTARELAAGASSTAVSAGLVVELAGLLCLAAFGTVVTARTVGRVRNAALPVLVSVSAALLVAVKLASAAPYLAARELRGDVSDEVVHALMETNGAAFVLCWIPMALLVGTAAASLRQAGSVGRAYAGTGAALSAAGLVLGTAGALDPEGANPIAFLLSLLWLAATSLRLGLRGVLRGGSRPAPAR